MKRNIFRAQSLRPEGIGSLAIFRSMFALFLMTAVWLVIAETVARTPAGYFLPPPSVGADSFEFDTKVYYLEQSIRQRGELDCLIVGDSMTNNGPDPRLIEEAYRNQTGSTLHCFNFGMPALFLDTSGPLAVALVNRFHPKLLILILSARDFDPSEGLPFRHVAGTDWAQQNLGKTSLRGWAVNSSYGYRYSLSFRYWLTPSNRNNFLDTWRSVTPQGFIPLYGYGEPRNIAPPGPPFQEGNIPAQNGFDQLLELHRRGVNILVIDAPIRPDFHAAWRDNYFQPYVEYMENTLAANAIPFWLTGELSGSFPSDSWYDLQHLNEKGIPLLSAWIGERLAQDYPPELLK